MLLSAILAAHCLLVPLLAAGPALAADTADAGGAQQRLAVMGIDPGIDRLVQFAGQGDMPVVTLLLKAGVPARAAEPVAGVTPLHTAAAQGHVQVMKALLAHGAAVDVADGRGNTPLLNAAYHGQADAARLLVEQGANVNAESGAGTSVLMAAVYGGKEAVLRLLLARGADPRHANAEGQTALDVAQRAGRAAMVAALRDRSGP